MLFPLQEIAPLQDTKTLREQISRLAQFDTAIFVSPNAVKYGIAAIRAGGEIPPALKVATVGQGSAQALRELGITDVIAPVERFDSEGLLAMPALQHVAGRKVMILRGDGGRELLGDTLKARGATVEYAACYRRSKPRQDAAMLLAAAPDAISVTSSEALANLWQMLDSGARQALRNTPLFAPHARIAGQAREQGWQQVELTASGDDGLLSALLAWSSRRKQG